MTANTRNTGKRKTHCIHGHEYTPENTYIKSTGIRGCKQCKKRLFAAYRAKRRALAVGPGQGVKD